MSVSSIYEGAALQPGTRSRNLCGHLAQRRNGRRITLTPEEWAIIWEPNIVDQPEDIPYWWRTSTGARGGHTMPG